MKNFQKYERLFSRDFCVPSIEAWTRGESIRPKGWTELFQPFLPYIVAEYTDDTVHFYYNMQGIEWVCDLLIKLSREEKNFIPRIEKAVAEKLAYIQPIYEKERAIKLSELKKFIAAYEDGFPWFEAMWLYFEMEPSKIAGLNLDNMQKLRAQTEKLCGGTDTVIRKSLEKIFPKLGLLSAFLRTEEIYKERLPTKAVLQSRSKRYFLANDQLFIGLTKTQVATRLEIQFLEEKVKKVRQLKGNIAQLGKAKGYVRRLMGHRQIHLLREGEILVSPMTIPDFLPAMKKAAAFVTDEGGVLCHAAIVAREMKKPCIVGTKFATKILKDGDYVEVNANHGIVTLLG